MSPPEKLPLPEDRLFMVRESGERIECWEAKKGDRVWLYGPDGQPHRAWQDAETTIHENYLMLVLIDPIPDEQRGFGVIWQIDILPGTEGTAPKQEPRPEWVEREKVRTEAAAFRGEVTP